MKDVEDGRIEEIIFIDVFLENLDQRMKEFILNDMSDETLIFRTNQTTNESDDCKLDVFLILVQKRNNFEGQFVFQQLNLYFGAVKSDTES